MPIFEEPSDPPPRIHAISDLRIEATPGLEGQLEFFYVDVLGLERVEDEPGMVCFETQRMRVRVLLTPEAQPSPIRRRAVIQVPSLERMRARLEEMGIQYEWYDGLAFTDQRIFVLDPADNRIELKQEWPI
jgi:catechol 2,3-dioxygenase-like lactoylglutathione lyase family enzyme